jgi:hypothetical protein
MTGKRGMTAVCRWESRRIQAGRKGSKVLPLVFVHRTRERSLHLLRAGPGRTSGGFAFSKGAGLTGAAAAGAGALG